MQGCLDNSLYSYIDGDQAFHLPAEYEHEKFHDPKFKQIDPHYPPATSAVLPQQYNITKYSIVAETLETSGRYCLSEKIFKPLIGGHLFVVLSGAGYLSYLRSVGFKTFGDYIDESYDDEHDINRRVNKIVEVCNTLKQINYLDLHEKIQGILEHNHKLFFNDGHLRTLNTDIITKVKKHFGE